MMRRMAHKFRIESELSVGGIRATDIAAAAIMALPSTELLLFCAYIEQFLLPMLSPGDIVDIGRLA